MENVRIKTFEIKNLFNQFSVCLPLEQQTNIFLGENGMGKTTILSCLYCALSGDVEKLASIIFDQITITLTNGKVCSIRHNDVSAYVNQYLESGLPRWRRNRLLKIFSKKELEEIQGLFVDNYGDLEVLKKYYPRISETRNILPRITLQDFGRLVASSIDCRDGKSERIIEFKEKIREVFNKEILYFPTYRRIEEDMSKLGIDIEDDRVQEGLIQFGMADVETAIEKLLATIRSAAITSFTEMTGVLLKQYLNGEFHEGCSIDSEKLTIALDRIGDKIEEHDKEKIKRLVDTSEIYECKNKYLLNLIENLIASYEKQNQYDERVRKFVSVCNTYLNGKRYIYDESNVQLAIYRDKVESLIRVQNLSSGEKQVISIFSKLYIEETKDCIILFDEPELSLSIKWQSKFLPDIMASGKCSTLVAVTHSPFIFENEFDNLAKDMGEYITENP